MDFSKLVFPTLDFSGRTSQELDVLKTIITDCIAWYSSNNEPNAYYYICGLLGYEIGPVIPSIYTNPTEASMLASLIDDSLSLPDHMEDYDSVMAWGMTGWVGVMNAKQSSYNAIINDLTFANIYQPILEACGIILPDSTSLTNEMSSTACTNLHNSLRIEWLTRMLSSIEKV